MSSPNRTDSVVLETITGRGSIYSIIHQQEVINRLEGLIAETEWNIFMLDEAQKAALKNKNRLFASLRTKYGLIITQLGSSALSILLAEHYLEAKPKFYEVAHSMLIMVNTINARLTAWASNEEIGKWFINNDSFETRNLFLSFHASYLKVEKKRCQDVNLIKRFKTVKSVSVKFH